MRKEEQRLPVARHSRTSPCSLIVKELAAGILRNLLPARGGGVYLTSQRPRIPGQPGGHSETLPQTKQNRAKTKNVFIFFHSPGLLLRLIQNATEAPSEVRNQD
jgi:hypothetical protein